MRRPQRWAIIYLTYLLIADYAWGGVTGRSLFSVVPENVLLQSQYGHWKDIFGTAENVRTGTWISPDQSEDKACLIISCSLDSLGRIVNTADYVNKDIFRYVPEYRTR